MPPDANAAYRAYVALGGLPRLVWFDSGGRLIVDGPSASGSRPLSADYAALVEGANTPACRSSRSTFLGIDDTGVAHGVAIRADATATFIAPSPAHHGDGVDCSGEISVHPLGITAFQVSNTSSA